ncbi:MAG: hypothetical protein Q6373_019225 [Candidatus Sigynarchaeota archaeon]
MQTEHLYGSIAAGNARKIDTVPGADHLTTPWDRAFISAATDWMVQTFDGAAPDLSFMAYDVRAIMLFASLIGLVGFVYGIGLLMARALGFKDKDHGQETRAIAVANGGIETRTELPAHKFVALYYAWTLLLIPTAIIPAMTFFLPLFMTSFIVTLVGCYSINVAIFSWRYFKRSGGSFKTAFTAGMRDWRIWLLGLVITAAIVPMFWLIVGQNYLGSIPPIDRLGFVLIYGTIMLFCYMAILNFGERVLMHYIDRKMRFKNEKVRYLIESTMSFLLVYSWFLVVLLLLCAAMGSMFLFMIAILMVPIYLFGSFAGVYIQGLTGSSIPNALLQATLMTLLIVSLSPMGSLLRMFM